MSDWKEMLDLSKSAVIVVDMQNDFCHEEGSGAMNGKDVSGCQEIVPQLQKLIDHAHQADIPVFFIKMTLDESTNSKVMQARYKNRKRLTCVTEWGTDYYGVQPTEKDIEVIKHRFSAFIQTDLELRLRAMGCETILVTGVNTSTCVESTIRNGFMLDFFNILVKDCTANTQPAPMAYEATLENVSRTFGWVSDSDEICAEMKKLVKKTA